VLVASLLLNMVYFPRNHFINLLWCFVVIDTALFMLLIDYICVISYRIPFVIKVDAKYYKIPLQKTSVVMGTCCQFFLHSPIGVSHLFWYGDRHTIDFFLKNHFLYFGVNYKHFLLFMMKLQLLFTHWSV